jgi:hypothetical protein
MEFHLWHFTHRAEDARRIQEEGFRDHSSGQLGIRWPCLSLAGERAWGPALVEVWIDIDQQLVDIYFTRFVRIGYHDILFYQIEPSFLNAPGVKRLAHDNADHLPRTSDAYPESP